MTKPDASDKPEMAIEPFACAPQLIAPSLFPSYLGR